jgi:alpha-galactosidase
LGQAAGRVMQEGTTEVWAKGMEDKSKAVGIFNRSESETKFTVKWSDLGLTGKQKVRDLWRQQDLGVGETEFQATVPRHGVVLLKVTPAS